jgi:hypothetical protein
VAKLVGVLVLRPCKNGTREPDADNAVEGKQVSKIVDYFS